MHGNRKLSSGIPLILVLLCGCTAQDRTKTRLKERDAFTTRTNTQAEDLLSESGQCSLQQCIDRALTHNLTLQVQQVQTQLARYDKHAAFSTFLPKIDLSIQRTGANVDPLIKAGPAYMQTSDRLITQGAISAQLPIFVPQAWFIFHMQSQGAEIQKFITQRLKQQIGLQVIAQYYACLAYESRSAHLEAVIHESKTLVTEVTALTREGLSLPSAQVAAETMLRAAEHALTMNQRAAKNAKGDLLSTLGLSPETAITLTRPDTTKHAFSDPSQLLQIALEKRLELFAADTHVSLQKSAIKRALSAFLPDLVLMGSRSYTSNSYMKYAYQWNYGVSGILSLFNGFKSIAEYKAARAQKQAAFAQREQHCLTIMLEVIKAWHSWKDAGQQTTLADDAVRIARMRLNEHKALKREGLLNESQYLTTLSAWQEAILQRELAGFQQTVAAHILHDVTGQSPIQKESP